MYEFTKILRSLCRLICLLSVFCMSMGLHAQTAGIPYQAVLLSKSTGQELPGDDASFSNPLSNSIVSIRFSIYDDNGLEFAERHNDVVVDGYGMINLIVGKGSYTFSDFDEMDWDGEEKWLKVEVDFENGSNFENLDYLSLHRIPDPDNQKIYLSGDSLLIENGGGIDLSTLLANAGNDNQSLTLVGNVIYLQNGGSIDLTELLSNAGTDDQRLSLTGTILNLEDGGTVNLATLINSVEDDQQLTYLTLNGSILEVAIEDGNSVQTSLVGLANDSLFLDNLLSNEGFIDTILLNELDGDPDNEMNISFNVLGNFLRIQDGGGILSVPLSLIQVDTTSLSNRIDDILLNDNDTDSTNEIQSISLSNDTLYLSNDGGAIDLSMYTNSEIETITIAINGQDEFSTPLTITNPNKLNVYRNGVKIGFTVMNTTTIKLETEAVCYQNDEIRIVQSF